MNKLVIDDNMYMKGVRIELYPNLIQLELIKRFIEATSYFYNDTIYFEEEVYNNHLKNNSLPSFLGKFEIEKRVSYIRNELHIFDDVPLHICRGGAFRAIAAYKNYFNKITNKPRLKDNSNISTSYSVRPDRFHFLGNCIKTEGIKDYIFCYKNNFPERLKIYNAQISIDPCNRIWLSFSYIENKIPLLIPKSEPIGIDVGFRLDNSNTIVCSNGMIFNQPDTQVLEYNIHRMDQICSNDNYRILAQAESTGKSFYDIQLSNNIMKRRLRLNQLYAKLHNIKENFINQTISYIVKSNPEYICIEDLSTTQLQQNNRFIDFLHFSQYRFKTKLIDKCNIHNIKLYLVDNKEYPSSKICSRCGVIFEINRCTDNFNCPNCGLHLHRDMNAAINLKNYPKFNVD